MKGTNPGDCGERLFTRREVPTTMSKATKKRAAKRVALAWQEYREVSGYLELAPGYTAAKVRELLGHHDGELWGDDFLVNGECVGTVVDEEVTEEERYDCRIQD